MAIDPLLQCEKCFKVHELCVCSSIQPVATQLQVLILQHPQEPDKDLGSARLAHMALPNSVLKVGLSWPNIKKALGKDAQSNRWAVLYLGSGVVGDPVDLPLQFVTKKGAPSARPKDLEGIVVLDGTWSQAKTLWWRNAWLLKLQRAVLIPQHKSLYKELRKEPRRECLSTIESVADALVALGDPSEASEKLRTLFSELLSKQRARLKSQK